MQPGASFFYPLLCELSEDHGERPETTFLEPVSLSITDLAHRLQHGDRVQFARGTQRRAEEMIAKRRAMQGMPKDNADRFAGRFNPFATNLPMKWPMKVRVN